PRVGTRGRASPKQRRGGVGQHPGCLGAGPDRGESLSMTEILLHPTASRTPGDDMLVRAVRAGDDRAFDTVVTRFEPALLAYARQLLGGAHHDAEECVQDTFVRALRALRGSDR